MLNLELKGKKGNSSIEYAFLITLVIGALIGMQAYLKGPVCQRWRLAGDAFGFGRQYAAGTAVPIPEDPPIILDPIYSAFKIIEIKGIEEINGSHSVQIGVEIPCDAERFEIVIWHLSDDEQSATKVKEISRECDRGKGIYYAFWDGETEDKSGNSYLVMDGTYIFEVNFKFDNKPYSKSQRMYKRYGSWTLK